jgi:phage terminase large subunit-like protein
VPKTATSAGDEEKDPKHSEKQRAAWRKDKEKQRRKKGIPLKAEAEPWNTFPPQAAGLVESFRRYPFAAFLPRYAGQMALLDDWLAWWVKKVERLENVKLSEIRAHPRFLRWSSQRHGVPRHLTVPQMDFASSQAQERWMVGSNRLGKSFMAALEYVWWATGVHPYRQVPEPPNLVWAGCPDWMNHGKPITVPHVRWALGQWPYKWREVERTFHVQPAASDGEPLLGAPPSRIVVKSYDSGADKWQGAEPQLVGYDEAPPESIHNEVGARVGQEPLNIIATLTPLYQASWIRTKIHRPWEDGGRPEHIHFISGDIRTNPNLDQAEVDRMEARYADDPEELKIRVYGDWAAIGGLLYPKLDVNVHMVDDFEIPGVHRPPKPDEQPWTLYRTIDPGIRVEAGVSWVACAPDGNCFAYRELFQADRSIPEICRWMRMLETKHEQFQYTTIDQAGKQRDYGTGKPRTLIYAENGVTCLAAGNKDVVVSVQEMKEVFRWSKDDDGNFRREPRLRIFRSCTNTWRELRNAAWAPHERSSPTDPREKTLKKDDHLENALRYLFVAFGGPRFVARKRGPEAPYEPQDKKTGY